MAFIETATATKADVDVPDDEREWFQAQLGRRQRYEATVRALRPDMPATCFVFKPEPVADRADVARALADLAVFDLHQARERRRNVGQELARARALGLRV